MQKDEKTCTDLIFVYQTLALLHVRFFNFSKQLYDVGISSILQINFSWFAQSLKVNIVLKFKSNSDAQTHNFPTAASTKKCKLALN